jgi:hypothetical protein
VKPADRGFVKRGRALTNQTVTANLHAHQHARTTTFTTPASDISFAKWDNFMKPTIQRPIRKDAIFYL